VKLFDWNLFATSSKLFKMTCPSRCTHTLTFVIIVLMSVSLIVHLPHTVECLSLPSPLSSPLSNVSPLSSSSSAEVESKLPLRRTRRGNRRPQPISSYNLPGMREGRCADMGNYGDCMLCGRVSDESRVFYGCCAGEERVLQFCAQLLA